jgi:hypothetical protein
VVVVVVDLTGNPLAWEVMTKPDPVALHPMQRVIAVAVAEQRPMLEALIDDYRDAVTRKVRGVSRRMPAAGWFPGQPRWGRDRQASTVSRAELVPTDLGSNPG